jgi:pantothenate kinase
VIGISGIPASGKSTFAVLLTKHINELLKYNNKRPESCSAVLVGLDGWHLTRAQLDQFPDAKLAHDRRGIHWTFDGDAYLSFIQKLKQDITDVSPVITAPSFDHALKDPVPEAITIYKYHRIVIIEGLYTFLSIEPWKTAGSHLDERWLLQVSTEEAHSRLIKRHVVTGVAKDLEEAIWRSETNDMPSACPCCFGSDLTHKTRWAFHPGKHTSTHESDS